MAYQIFTERVLELIASIPRGKVMTYGQIAAFCGHARAARQVARLLSRLSQKHDLPWHRVINSKGQISFAESEAYHMQKSMLTDENIIFEQNDKIDLTKYQWRPGD